ncbi:MAG: hypothetical protein L7F77_14690 [Candidatus Magnetominusculus sp. LBB02]|nr:hypothetical protein [Candidatus Magnetominusculus sp. LBB02]
MLKQLQPKILKEAMLVCLETEELYFSHPLKERIKVVLYIYNLCNRCKISVLKMQQSGPAADDYNCNAQPLY